MRGKSRKISLAGLLIAIGIILPFFTGQLPSIGNKLLPMHIPVLLAGYLLGGPMALLVGFIVPIFKSFLTTMPPMLPNAIAMAFELATYGLVTGVLYRALARNKINIFISLIGGMISGRVVWGIASFILYGIQASPFNMQIFIAGAFLNAIPGIIIQLILIPLLVGALEGMDLIEE